MIQSKIFRNHYLFTVAIVLAFMVLGFLLTHVLLNSVIHHLGPRPPSLFFANAIDERGPSHRREMLDEIIRWGQSKTPFQMVLLDRLGHPETPIDGLTDDFSALHLPTEVLQEQVVSNHQRGPAESAVVRLPGEPTEYLFLRMKQESPPPVIFIFATFGVLLLSILMGVGVALFVIFRSMKRTVDLADGVISELRNGNLKARFPITKLDEVGNAMGRFNKMADEIERLVDRLRNMEVSRMALLQELAHDLRTPVASLKHLIETLSADGATLESHLREEVLSLALKETDYFERLVEDLLVLAQVGEPQYRAHRESVDLRELLSEEIAGVQTQYRTMGKNISVKDHLPVDPVEFFGDIHLLRRMFRNTLENAFSFAHSEVHVDVQLREDIQIRISDDGNGFSPDAMTHYGERRVTRVLATPQLGSDSRLSVGLGSVIIKTIAHIHRGSVHAQNLSQNGMIKGGQVLLRLPSAS
jgi:signal transduction histidine kinase